MKNRRLRWRIWWKNYRARRKREWGPKWKTIAIWHPIPAPDYNLGKGIDNVRMYYCALDELAVNIKNHLRRH